MSLVDALMVAYLSLSAVDAAQTHVFLRDGTAREGNPLLSSEAAELAVKVGIGTGLAVGLHHVKRQHPTLARWLAVSAVVAQGSVVAWNAHVMEDR